MKIAIIAPHPVPFAIGGAENLWWGLQDHIQNETEHECDIVALISPEYDLDVLLKSYEAFSKLDLSAYDCVISTKYPAWMVRHPNHVIYMMHRLRGLYDTYNGASIEALSGRARGFADWMIETGAKDHGGDDALIQECFERYNVLRQSDLPNEIFAFPGPLAQTIIQFLDGIALSPRRIVRHTSIAKNLAARDGYFPPNVDVSVLYPPPHRHDYHEGRSDYFFTSSRLDGPKRIDLLIKAMEHVAGDTELLIAGAGPDAERLKAMAASDKRIRFLGFVADDDMPGLYANALAVPFVPNNEDYGLITIEAMRSAKPVITVTDSGGPTEFVTDGETGFLTQPEPKALGAAMMKLCDDRELAHRMGQNAKQRVAPVTWDTVFKGLMKREPRAALTPKTRRPKLTIATTFPIYPPMGGGQSRVYNLYKEMARKYDIDIVSLGDLHDRASETEIAPGVIEMRIPRSQLHAQREYDLSQQVGGFPIGDIAASVTTGLTPDYLRQLEISCAGSVAVIACHPYLIDAIRQAAPTLPLWYEAQDVELNLKTRLLEGQAQSKALLDIVADAEGRCWREAQHVFACAERDLEELGRLYGPTRAHLHEVANGTALEQINYVDPEQRASLQTRLGLDESKIALFMGSWHGPNLDAVEQIIATADKFPNVRFVVLGSVCKPFEKRDRPANLDLLGQVSNLVRDDLLSTAHVALNPMREGSGTNLKMLDYFAAGIPVISTEFGARGLKAEAGAHYVQSPLDDLTQGIADFLTLDKSARSAIVREARAMTEANYSWAGIADRFLVELEETGKRRGRQIRA